MDKERKDAQKLELSAQAEGSSDALQLDPSDLSADFAVSSAKSKIPHQPKPTDKVLDHNIFNALVAPPSPRTTPPEDRIAMETQSALSNNLDAADAAQLILPPILDLAETPPADAAIEEPILEDQTIETPSPDAIIAEAFPVLADADQFIDEPLMADADQIIDRIASEVFNDIEADEDPAPLILKLPLQDITQAESSSKEVYTPDYDDWEPLPPELMRIVPQESQSDHQLVIEEPVEAPLDEIVVDAVETEDSAIEQAVAIVPVVEAAPIEVEMEVPRTFYDPAAVIPDEPVAELAVAELPVEAEAPVFNFSSQPIQALEADTVSDETDTDSEEVVEEPVAEDSPVYVELKPAAEQDQPAVASGRTGAWWSIPMLCLGIAIAACAVLVPMADENRRVTHELAQIEQDANYFQKQSDVNKEFLERVSSDPTLAERLAMRQLRLTRADARLADIPQRASTYGMSPYQLVAVEPPMKLPEYRPMGGFLSKYFLNTKIQIYLAGLGILLAAAGVILGGGNDQNHASEEE